MVTLKSDWCWERNDVQEFANDLCRRNDRAFFFGELGQSLSELGVTVLLTSVGGGQEVLRGSQVGSKLSAVAAVGAPSQRQGKTQSPSESERRELEVETERHEKNSREF